MGKTQLVLENNATVIQALCLVGKSIESICQAVSELSVLVRHADADAEGGRIVMKCELVRACFWGRPTHWAFQVFVLGAKWSQGKEGELETRCPWLIIKTRLQPRSSYLISVSGPPTLDLYNTFTWKHSATHPMDQDLINIVMLSHWPICLYHVPQRPCLSESDVMSGGYQHLWYLHAVR